MRFPTIPRLPQAAGFRIACAAVLLASGSSATAQAVEESSAINERLELAGTPLVYRSRLRIANEFSENETEGDRDKLVLGAAFGFGFDGVNRNYAAGFDLPLLHREAPGEDECWGLGDLKLRFGQKWMDQPGAWRAGWFFESEFDTADDAVRAIANQRTQMAFGGGAARPLGDWFLLTGTLQYGWSLDEGTTNGSKSEWETHFVASFQPTSHLSFNLDYKATLNTAGTNDVMNALEPGVGWTFGEDHEFGLSVSCEVPLNESSTDWTSKIGLTWFF